MPQAHTFVQTPRTIQSAVALTLAGIILVPATIWPAHPSWALASVALNLFLAYFLLRRSTVAWWLLLFVASLAVLLLATDHEAWWLCARSLFVAALVLMPASQRFVFAAAESPPVRECPFGPRPDPDHTRASAWHLDPSDPKRMSHWSSSDQSWGRTTRTPRRLRRVVRAYGLDQPHR
jgi:hypothetical protein